VEHKNSEKAVHWAVRTVEKRTVEKEEQRSSGMNKILVKKNYRRQSNEEK